MSVNLLLLLLSLILSQQQSIVCPAGTTGDTVITNNCGMAQWCQPSSPETCTEISLVDGYCCYVKFKGGNGASCIRQGEIDEDNKNEITDEMRKAVNRLKPATVNVEIESVQCKGYYIAFYGLSLLLLAVML